MVSLAGLRDAGGFISEAASHLSLAHLRNLSLLALDMARPAGGRVRGLPLSVGIYINGVCNRQCRHCYYDWDNPGFVRQNISLERFRELLRLPVARHALRFSLAGGEPFLHPQLFDLVEEARRRGLYTIVHTNGSLLLKRLDDLVRSPLNSLNVSLYDDAREATLAAVREVAAEGGRRGGRLRVSLSRIVSRPGLEEMLPVARAALAHGVKRVFFQNYYTREAAEADLVVVDDGRYRSLCQELSRFARQNGMVVFPPAALRGGGPGGPGFCLSLVGTIAYDARGQVSPCCFIAPPDGSFGTVFEEDPFNSRRYLSLRQQILRGQGRRLASCRYCTLLSSRWVKYF